MIITVTAIILVAAILVAILRPLLRGAQEEDHEADAEISVYKEQLQELEREKEQGLIGEAEASAAAVEIQRRLLAVHRRGPRTMRGGRRPIAALTIALALIAVTGGIYWQLGSPRVPDAPFALRQTEEPSPMQAEGGDLTSRIEEVVARLEQDSDNADLWWILAQSYEALGRYDKEVEALQHVLRLTDENPSVLAVYGEALIKANGGDVTMPALLAFNQILESDPSNPRARYYLALADAQAQNFDAAFERWLDLYNDSTPEAPWLPLVREHLVEMASLTGRDIDEFLPEAPPADGYQAVIAEAQRQMASGDEAAARETLQAAEARFAGAPFVLMQIRQAAAQMGLAPPTRPGPSEADVAAAAEMTPEDRMAMIRGMVEGLAARLESDPDDLEGWLMLMRSQLVLGDRSEAMAALASAKEAFAADQDALGTLDAVAAELGLGES